MTAFAFRLLLLFSKRTIVYKSLFLLFIMLLCVGLRLHIINFHKQLLKYLFHVYVFRRRAFIKYQFVLVSEFLCFFLRYFSFFKFFINQINFISNQNNHNVRLSMVFKLSKPFLHMSESVLFGHVIHD